MKDVGIVILAGVIGVRFTPRAAPGWRDVEAFKPARLHVEWLENCFSRQDAKDAKNFLYPARFFLGALGVLAAK
jgi:hypothetical protein